MATTRIRPPNESTDLQEVRAQIRGETAEHFYAALLGLRIYETRKLYEAVTHGLKFATFSRLVQNTMLPQSVIAEVVQVSDRTLARRREKGKLEPGESDRLLRFSRLFGLALQLFEGDADAARTWLLSKPKALGGRTPLELSMTEIGAREVEDLIGRLEHGIPS